MGHISIDVLKEGTRIDSYRGQVKISRECCSAVVLLRDGSNNILVDSGSIGYADEILGRLKAVGAHPDDINILINTHAHLDHVYNNHLFKKARIYTPTSIWYPEDGNRVEMYPHVVDLNLPGIKLIDTPGHMEKHISVVVDSDGKKTVITGDAVRESIIEAGRIPQRYSHRRAYIRSMAKIFSIADEIIPGHGKTINGKRLKKLHSRLRKIAAEEGIGA